MKQIKNYKYLIMKTKTIISQSIITLIPLLYLIFVWKTLPDMVPTHFDLHFKADGFGTKFELLGIILFTTFITIGVSVLLLNINRIDPKQIGKELNPRFIKLSWVISIFLTLIFILVINKVSNGSNFDNSEKYFTALVCLLFAVMGNFMNNLKPNYFFGVRTPWNLSDEENWRKTHQLTSKLWFYCGLALVILVFILPKSLSTITILICLASMCVIPFFYSYLLFKEKQSV